VRVGLDPGATVRPPSPYASPGRIVAYGTSITQGGCASRPGMAYTNLLSRSLNMEVVNLGFSGSGKGEPEVARVVARVPDPCLFVLDYEANCQGADRLAATLPEFIRILRDAHAGAAILVVSRIAFARDALSEEALRQREQGRAAAAQAVEDLRDRGDTRVHFLDGATLLGEDFDECTVDGVHPNDLGFLRIARGLASVVGEILGG